MYQIRKGVFETNSSSTHSICISKKPVKNLPDMVQFAVGEYGWEEGVVTDTASYLWTAILDGPQELIEERTQRLKDALGRLGVQYFFHYPKKDSYGYYDSGYVDHAYECADLIEALLSDDDLLARYLFGNSVIYTGNDNSSENNALCWSAEEMVYDDDTNDLLPNFHHDSENYDYFFKGN